MPTYCVLGYGGMGKIIIKDLFETTRDAIIVAGRNRRSAQQVADQYHLHHRSRVTARQADVTNIPSLVRAFHGVDVVIHAVHHEYNVNVMKACLAAGCHYTDLGGLYHWVRPQLQLCGAFKKKNLTAVISMGAAPGISDVLAAYAAKQLDRVQSVDIRVGSVDKTKVIRPSPLSSSYSLDTIFQECSYPPAVLKNGRVEFVEPMSGREPYLFPPPVGSKKPMHTIHSEIVTIPRALKRAGIKNCSFKIAFDDDFVEKIRFLKELGLLSEKAVPISGVSVVPRTFLAAALKQLPPPLLGTPDQYEIIRAVVTGKKKGVPRTQTIVADCHTRGMPAWRIGVDIDTGSPASIAAQMIARGDITQRGVFVAGEAIPPELFFKELRKRKMSIFINNRRLIM